MKHFTSSIVITIIGLVAAYYWAGLSGLALVAILAVMETSLSFDNAVVNATVLRDMEPRWQRRFLTWGMIVAVFGVRFLLPILIVAVVSGQSLIAVSRMALEAPDDYARHLAASHVQISAFGGMYLLLVFFSFLFQKGKSLHWVVWLERRLSQMGKLESIEIVLALAILLTAQYVLPLEEKLDALVAGVCGVILFVLIKSISDLFNQTEGASPARRRSGLVSFLYLELLDLSFSFDGVVGAFAITRDVVIILLGLTIGAWFVRSLTVFLVRKRTLDEYLYLEHGAHYAIGALALLMLLNMSVHVPETVTGLIGIGFILMSFWSSVRHNRCQRQKPAPAPE